MNIRRIFNRLWRAEVKRQVGWQRRVTIEDLIRKEGREPGGKSMARYRFVPEPGLVFKRYPEPSRAIKLSFDRSTHVTLGKARYVNVKVVTTGLPPTAGKIDAYLELDK